MLWIQRTFPLLTAGLLMVRPQSMPTVPTGQAEHVRIEAGGFAFSPSQVAVDQGAIVTLTLVATDYVHGFYLEGYDLEVVADPGQPATLTFSADRPGTFRFRCSVSCGPLHPFMTGRLRVGPSPFPLTLLVALAAAVLGVVAWRRPSKPAGTSP